MTISIYTPDPQWPPAYPSNTGGSVYTDSAVFRRTL